LSDNHLLLGAAPSSQLTSRLRRNNANNPSNLASNPRVLSIASVVGGGLAVASSYMSWASVSLLWASDSLSRPAAEVWMTRYAGVAMVLCGLASLRSRWRWLLAPSALALICVSVAVSAAIGDYVAWQQQNSAGSFSLDPGLLLAVAGAVVSLLVATWGTVRLGWSRLAETRHSVRSVRTSLKGQGSPTAHA
jgi:hypothetical protein